MIVDNDFRMNKLAKLNPWLSQERVKLMVSSSGRFPEDRPEYRFDLTEIQAYCDLVRPVSPLNKCRQSDITKLLDPATDSDIKEMLQKRLDDMPSLDASQLSDDDILAMLPSRYAQGYDQACAYMDYAREYIDKLNQLDAEKARSAELNKQNTE